MALTGAQSKRLHGALLRAFPGRGDLAQFVRFELDRHLSAIAGGDDLSDVVFRLLERAEAEGWLPTLVEQAHAARPHDADLRALAGALGAGAAARTLRIGVPARKPDLVGREQL